MVRAKSQRQTKPFPDLNKQKTTIEDGQATAVYLHAHRFELEWGFALDRHALKRRVKMGLGMGDVSVLGMGGEEAEQSEFGLQLSDYFLFLWFAHFRL